MNTKQLTVLWFTAIAAAIILSFAPGTREVLRPYFVLASIIVIAATLIYTLRPHPNAKVRLLWLTVGIPVVLLVIGGFVINYFSQLPSAPPAPSVPPVRASSEKFQQVEISLVEPYSFKMNNSGRVEGWIRNKSSVPIDAVDFHVEIKNFAGDTITSETHTVTTQIPPSQATHVEFIVSSSPADSGLFGGSDRSPTMVNEAKQVDLGEVLAKYGGKSPAMVNEAKQFDPDEYLAKYSQWSWQMKIEAAGTNKR